MDTRGGWTPGLVMGNKRITDPRVIIMFTSLCCSLVLGLAIKYNNNHNTGPDIVDEIVQVNVTQCTLLNQYQFWGQVEVSVCDHVYEGLKVDIREYLNRRPTMKGITLNKSTFLPLIHFWPNITSTVLKHHG